MTNSDIPNTRQNIKGVNDLKRYANRVGHRDTHYVLKFQDDVSAFFKAMLGIPYSEIKGRLDRILVVSSNPSHVRCTQCNIMH